MCYVYAGLLLLYYLMDESKERLKSGFPCSGSGNGNFNFFYLFCLLKPHITYEEKEVTLCNNRDNGANLLTLNEHF